MSVEFNSGTLGDVQLEPGSVATPFESRPIGLELALCQRYYEKSDLPPIWSGMVTVGHVYYNHNRFKVEKRAVPTMTYVECGVNGFDSGAPTQDTVRVDGVQVNRLALATIPNGHYQYSWTASAEL
jgi:hypothetical protein